LQKKYYQITELLKTNGYVESKGQFHNQSRKTKACMKVIRSFIRQKNLNNEAQQRLQATIDNQRNKLLSTLEYYE
jgi:uncharacterized membrane protein YgaE (UPF0421/DUF939 family)